MVTLTIKNIPDRIYRLLKKRSTLHRRSINSEVILCIENSVGVRRIEPEEILIGAMISYGPNFVPAANGIA